MVRTCIETVRTCIELVRIFNKSPKKYSRRLLSAFALFETLGAFDSASTTVLRLKVSQIRVQNCSFLSTSS